MLQLLCAGNQQINMKKVILLHTDVLKDSLLSDNSFIILLMFVLMTGIDFESAFSAVGACLNNLGPGLGMVSENYANINSISKGILAFAMLLGRLEIFTLLVILTPMFWSK